MKILKGSFKGVDLATPEQMGVRPTVDHFKKHILRLVGEPPPQVIWDLFAGSGGVGLELLSGGAREAVFVDQLKSAISCIRLNLGESQIKNQQEFAKRTTQVIFAETGAFLDQPGTFGVSKAPELIFMDPPYGQGFIAKTLEQLAKCPVLQANYIKSPLFILIEHVSEEIVKPLESGRFDLATQEVYGPKSLTLLRLRS